jgi:hypothetical protein
MSPTGFVSCCSSFFFVVGNELCNFIMKYTMRFVTNVEIYYKSDTDLVHCDPLRCHMHIPNERCVSSQQKQGGVTM